MNAPGPAAPPAPPPDAPSAPGPLAPGDLAALLTGIVQLGADGIVAVDDEQRILLFNRGAEEIFGYAAAEVLGRPLDALIPARYHAQHAAEHLPFFARGHPTSRRMAERAEVYAVRKGGEEFPAEIAIGRVAVGGRTVYTAVVRDATERRRHEAELRERGDALARAARARDEVLAIVSHDLRNPLSTVSMCARALTLAADGAGAGGAGGVEAARVRELADTAYRSAAWAQRIIRDLLDAARLEEGGLALYPEAVPASALLDTLRELHAAQAADAGVVLEVAAAGALPAGLPPAWADADRVVQALGNLVANAIKFTPAGGRVAVDAAPAELAGAPAVALRVRDTGRGIPAEHLPHLFDRFWQARETRRGGAGLGLAIARGIVTQHGGEVAVASEVGRGTTFTVVLPAAGGGGPAAPAR
jgi:PAS domain S-box-containing protein